MSTSNVTPGRQLRSTEPSAAERDGVYSAEPGGVSGPGTDQIDGRGPFADREAWASRSRIVLTPIAAPSVLGLFGFFAATIMVGSNLAGWWGTTSSSLEIFTFAAMFGGLAQLLAAMWSFRARDVAAVAVHGAWGSFWLAYGIQNLLVATGKLPATGKRASRWPGGSSVSPP